MPASLLDIPQALPVFALVFFRLSGLMIAAPVFSSSLIPARVRGAILVATAGLLFPMLNLQAPGELSMVTLLVGGVGEMMIGVIIGLSCAILLMGVEVAGHIVGQQAGIALGEVFDPTFEQETTVVGQVYLLTMTAMFLIAGGHRAMMAAVLDSYRVIPLLSFRFDESFVLLLVELLGAAFILGIRLAGPVLIALFLSTLAMGLISRTMPQLNILSVGFTIRVMLAIGVAGASLALSKSLLLEAIWNGLTLIRAAFGLDPTQTRLVF